MKSIRTMTRNKLEAEYLKLAARVSILEGQVAGHHDRIQTLTLRIEALTGDRDKVVNTLNLTKNEFNMLYFMLVRSPRICSKETLFDARHGSRFVLHDHADPKIVDVLIVRIRKALSLLGIEVENQWGVGYRIRKEDADRLTNIIYGVEDD